MVGTSEGRATRTSTRFRVSGETSGSLHGDDVPTEVRGGRKHRFSSPLLLDSQVLRTGVRPTSRYPVSAHEFRLPRSRARAPPHTKPGAGPYVFASPPPSPPVARPPTVGPGRQALSTYLYRPSLAGRAPRPVSGVAQAPSQPGTLDPREPFFLFVLCLASPRREARRTSPSPSKSFHPWTGCGPGGLRGSGGVNSQSFDGGVRAQGKESLTSETSPTQRGLCAPTHTTPVGRHRTRQGEERTEGLEGQVDPFGLPGTHSGSLIYLIIYLFIYLCVYLLTFLGRPTPFP